MTDPSNDLPVQERDKKNELRLALLKDEIASQANAFDQIDSKTGVALGFTFVVVGQVLASVFRIATDQSHLSSTHPVLTTSVFVGANCVAIAAILSGIVARWPRQFHHAMEFDAKDLQGSYPDMMTSAIDALSKGSITNQTTISSKGWWAQATYLLVGVALIGYLGLTVVLYAYSIPREAQQDGPMAANHQVSPTVERFIQSSAAPQSQGLNSTKVTPSHSTPSRDDRSRTTASKRSPSEIEQRVKAIIVEQLQVNESDVKPSATFKHDLGADDLDVAELVMQFEEAFNLEIPDEDVKKLEKVQDAVNYIKVHTGQQSH